MVGDDAVAGATFRLDAHDVFDRADQRAEQVSVENALLALQHAGHTLEAHAGIDRRTRQQRALARCGLLELHEDEVPEFEEAIAILFRRAGRTAPDVFALVDEDFRARTAGTGIAHLPEIVGGRDADDLVVGETGDLLPQGRSFLVLGIDGYQQPVLRQVKTFGDELPGKLDRILLEIVAEGEVAEHFEEGQVAGGITDIVEVVVLAAGTHAFL
ncbi:hypothetical protein D3C73_786680 [compost metagenome]